MLLKITEDFFINPEDILMMIPNQANIEEHIVYFKGIKSPTLSVVKKYYILLKTRL